MSLNRSSTTKSLLDLANANKASAPLTEKELAEKLAKAQQNTLQVPKFAFDYDSDNDSEMYRDGGHDYGYHDVTKHPLKQKYVAHREVVAPVSTPAAVTVGADEEAPRITFNK
jgi:hypothetical protein